MSHQIYAKVQVHSLSWPHGKTESSWLTALKWIGPKLHEHTCCTFMLPAECPLCVCVWETPALPCQNATCSSWLQLNGKLEILTIDLVVHKWLGNVFQGGDGYLTVHHPAWRHIYLTGGLSIHTPPFFTCSPPCFHVGLSRGKKQHSTENLGFTINVGAGYKGKLFF